MTPERKNIYILSLIGILVFFYGLGRADLWGDQVARNARMAREMIQRGEWIVPYVNGQPNYEKPILWSWILMASCLPLGVNEFSMRLPCAILALGIVYVVYALGRRLSGARCGFMAALMYMTSMRIMHMARVPRIDLSLAFFVSLAFFFFLRGYQDEERRRSSYVWAAISMALAFLDKGPVGVIIPAGGIFFFLLAAGDMSQLLPLLSPRNIIAFLAVAAPWYIAVSIRTNGAFPQKFFIYYHMTLYTAYSRSQPFWYYLPHLLTGFLPWGVFLPFAVAGAFAESRRSPGLLPLAWLLWGFVFFSMGVYKRNDYLQPLFPAAALLTAIFLSSVEREEAGWRITMSRIMVWLLLIVVVAAIALAGTICIPGSLERFTSLGIVRNYTNQRDLDAMAVYTGIMRREGALFVISLCAAAVFLFFILQRAAKGRVNAVGITAGIAAVMIALNTFYLHSILPEIDRDTSMRPYSRLLAAHVSPGDRFGCYDFYDWDIGYYMERNVTELQTPEELREYFSRPEQGYCLVVARRLDEALEIIGDLPHRIEPALADPKGRLTMIVRPEDPAGSGNP